MEEIIDIYDRNRNKTGRTIIRRSGSTLSKNEYVIAVHCWIVNSNGNILLTQRTLNKDNRWKMGMYKWTYSIWRNKH